MNKVAKVLRIAILVLLYGSTNAAMGADISAGDATSTARSTATSENSSYFGKINSTSLVNQPAYTEDKPSQAQYFQKGQGLLQSPGISRVASCDGKTDPECVAVQLMKNGRPTMTIGATDPLRTRVGDIRMTDPRGQLSGVLDSYSACGQVATTTPAQHEARVCHERLQAEENQSCTAGIEVNVDADANYQCRETPNALVKQSCSRILTVTCDPPIVNCAKSAITNIHADLQVGAETYTYTLEDSTFTLIAERSTGSSWTVHYYFTINDLSKFSIFFLEKVETNQMIWVGVNGVGRGTYNKGVGPAIDLKPYLKEGENRIEMSSFITTGPSPAYARVVIKTTKGDCGPGKCYDAWDDSACDALAARVQ